MSEIDRLREARKKVDAYRYLVEQEMREKGDAGVLWQNGNCKSWPDYENALLELDNLREELKV